LSNYDAVTTLFERALVIGFAEPRARVAIQAELGSALVFTRRLDDADVVLAEAHANGLRLGERGIAAGALVRRSWNYTGDHTVSYEDHLAAAREAIVTLSEVGDERGVAEARRLLGLALANLNRHDEARAELELALGHAEASGDVELRRTVINTLLGLIHITGPTPVAEGITFCEQLIPSAAGQRMLEATLQRALGIFLAMDARAAEAQDALARGGAVLDEVRLRHMEVHRGPVAYARLLCGDPDGAEREFLMSWNYFRDIRGERFDTRAWKSANSLASLYCEEGRFTEAAAFHAYGRDEHRTHPGHHLSWLSVEALLGAHDGRFDDAAELAAQSTDDVEMFGGLNTAAELLATASRVLQLAGRLEEADGFAARAFVLFERKGNLAGAARLQASSAQPV
jgi:tetratricopeptide (TPR) repeat protein